MSAMMFEFGRGCVWGEEEGRQQRRTGRKELSPDSTLDRGPSCASSEVRNISARWLCARWCDRTDVQQVGSLQLTPRLHLHTSHTRQLAESLACSLCVIMLGQSQGSPLTRRRQCSLLPFAARRTPLTARLLVGYSFPGWNRGNQLTLVLFVN